MKANTLDINMYTVFIIGVLTIMIFIVGCGASNEEVYNAESHTDPTATLEDKYDSYDWEIKQYVRNNPDVTFTYIPSANGNVKTAKGNFTAVVDGVATEKTERKYLEYVAKRYKSRKALRDAFNANIDKEAKAEGGLDAIYERVERNIQYPANAGDVQGTMMVEFTVLKNGAVADVKAVDGEFITADSDLRSHLEHQAEMAIIATSGMWDPAETDNKRVEQKMELPITFNASSIAGSGQARITARR